MDLSPADWLARRLPDDIRTAWPVRGLLSLTGTGPGWYPGLRNAPLTTFLMAADRMEGLLEPLRRAQVAKIKQGSLLIVGVQHVIRPIRVSEEVRQAWWVRPAGP